MNVHGIGPGAARHATRRPATLTPQPAGDPDDADDHDPARAPAAPRVFDGAGGPRVVGPHDGAFVDLRSVGVRFLVWGAESGGDFSLVEHPIPPRTLVAPLHLHEREDEYSYVLEGRMGAQLGDDVVFAGPGDLVFKPRNQWHTFWNPGDTPCRILEIISPAGFEHFFRELGDAMRTARAASAAAVPDVAALAARYGHHFQPESVARLCREHGLVYPA